LKFTKDSDRGHEESYAEITDPPDGQNSSPAVTNTDNESFQVQWEEVCEKITSDPESTIYRKNLEAFLIGISQLEAAQASLQGTYEEIQKSLGSSLERSLAIIVPVHEITSSVISNKENEMQALFHQNHQTRKEVLRFLNNYNKAWQAKYNNFMIRIVPNEIIESSSTEGIVGDSDAEVDKAHRNGNDIVVLDKVNCDDAVCEDPNWDELIIMNPSAREKIEPFLIGCDRWIVACNELNSSFDEIRKNLDVSHANILNIIESAYSRITDELDKERRDLHNFIMSNFYRRNEIEQSLQEVVQHQNKVLSQLMARVGGNISTASIPNVAEKSKMLKFSSLIPFTSIFPLSG
jgi:aspartate/glutamate racemase